MNTDLKVELARIKGKIKEWEESVKKLKQNLNKLNLQAYELEENMEKDAKKKIIQESLKSFCVGDIRWVRNPTTTWGLKLGYSRQRIVEMLPDTIVVQDLEGDKKTMRVPIKEGHFYFLDLSLDSYVFAE